MWSANFSHLPMKAPKRIKCVLRGKRSWNGLNDWDVRHIQNISATQKTKTATVLLSTIKNNYMPTSSILITLLYSFIRITAVYDTIEKVSHE